MQLTNTAAMIDTLYAQMDQMFVGLGEQLGITPSEQAIFDNYMKKVATAMQEDMSWEKMKGPMIDIYLKNYTEEEIQDMLDFYRSDTGRSMVEKMPGVMKESMTVSQDMMQGFMPKIAEFAKELSEEIKAHRASQ